jgi:hypothetical protein
MTLSVQTVRQLYNGNGSTTSFAIPFSFEANDEVEVILVSSAGVETVQSYTTHYTISGSNVSMVTAPASGQSLLIRMDVDLDQETDLSDQAPFLPSTIEAELDEIVAQVQMLNERINRCLTFPKSSTHTLVEFPRSLSSKSGYVPSVKSSEDGFEFVVTTDQITSAAASAAAAASSASSAASSATSASSSATSAAASAAAAAASVAGLGTEIQEMLSGTVNGVNTTFTLSQTPVSAASFKLYRSGILLIVGTHYTRSGTTVTMVNAPVSPQTIHANYRY